MSGVIFWIVVGLVYIVLIYAGLPLGAILIVWGLFALRKAKRAPATTLVPDLAEGEIDEDDPKLFAEGLIYIGIILMVLGGAANLWQVYG